MRLETLGTATHVLRQDHLKIRDHFDLFEECEDLSEQKEILETIIRELRQHIQLEEQIFYPAVREVAQADHLVDQALEEHQELNDVLDDLQSIELEDPLFLDKFMELEDKILRHLKLEESEIFPHVETMGLDLQSLGDTMRERKKAGQESVS